MAVVAAAPLVTHVMAAPQVTAHTVLTLLLAPAPDLGTLDAGLGEVLVLGGHGPRHALVVTRHGLDVTHLRCDVTRGGRGQVRPVNLVLVTSVIAGPGLHGARGWLLVWARAWAWLRLAWARGQGWGLAYIRAGLPLVTLGVILLLGVTIAGILLHPGPGGGGGVPGVRVQAGAVHAVVHVVQRRVEVRHHLGVCGHPSWKWNVFIVLFAVNYSIFVAIHFMLEKSSKLIKGLLED